MFLKFFVKIRNILYIFRPGDANQQTFLTNKYNFFTNYMTFIKKGD